MKRRILSMLLTLTMVISLVPGMAVTASAAASHIDHCVCGDAGCGEHGSETGWQAWEQSDRLPTQAGKYYLTKDVNLNLSTPDYVGVTICLNGFVVTRGENGDIMLHAGESLTLTDCQSTTHKFSVGYNGRWERNESSGNKIVYGGVITGVGANPRAGVKLEGGTFTMYGGNIVGNGSGGTGGGIIATTDSSGTTGSTVTIYGGKICGNSTTANGGGISVFKSTLNLYGGEISENTAKYDGGGINSRNGTVNVHGAPVVSGNKSDGAVNNVEANSAINIDGALTQGAQIGITAAADAIIANGWNNMPPNADPNQYFISDTEGHSFIAADGALKCVAGAAAGGEITFTTDLNSQNSISSVDTKTLTVEATCADYNGELTYQWYYCGTTSSKTNATPIEGATSNSCTVKPDTEKEHHYYFCRVTAGEVVGDSVVAGVYASDPSVYINNTDNLYETCYAVTDKPYTVEITNTSTNVVSGELCYQWYRCTDSNGTGAEAIEGAITESFTVPTNAKGTSYYFGKAYIKVNGSEICSDVTMVAKVIVRDAHKITTAGTPNEDGDIIVEGGKFSFTGYGLQDDLTCPTGETCKLTYKPDNGYTVDKILVYKTGEPEVTVELREWDSDTKQFTMPDFDITVEVTFKKLVPIEKVDLTVDWSRVPNISVGQNVLDAEFNPYYDWAVFTDGAGAVNGPASQVFFTVKVTDSNKTEICNALVASGFNGLTPNDLPDLLEMLGCGTWLHPELLFSIDGYVVKENDVLAIMPIVNPYSGYFPFVGNNSMGAYNGTVTCNGETVSSSAVFGQYGMPMLLPFVEVGTVSKLAEKKAAAKTEVFDIYYADPYGYTTGGSYGVVPGIAAKDETIAIRVTPDEGYEVDTVTWQPFVMASDGEGDGTYKVEPDANGYHFTMPDFGDIEMPMAVVVRVTFKATEQPEVASIEFTFSYDETIGAIESGKKLPDLSSMLPSNAVYITDTNGQRLDVNSISFTWLWKDPSLPSDEGGWGYPDGYNDHIAVEGAQYGFRVNVIGDGTYDFGEAWDSLVAVTTFDDEKFAFMNIGEGDPCWVEEETYKFAAMVEAVVGDESGNIENLGAGSFSVDEEGNVTFNTPADDGYLYYPIVMPTAALEGSPYTAEQYVQFYMEGTKHPVMDVTDSNVFDLSNVDAVRPLAHTGTGQVYVTNFAVNATDSTWKINSDSIIAVLKLRADNMVSGEYGNSYFPGLGFANVYAYGIHGVYAAIAEFESSGGGSGTPETPTPTPPASRPSSGDSYTPPTVNVPMSNDENKVDVKAEVSGKDATIKPLDNKQIEQLVGDKGASGDVVVDLSKLGKDIDTAGIPKKTLEAIVDAAEDAGNDTEHLVIKLTTAELKLDDAAMRAIVDQSKGDIIKFNFDDVGTERLNYKQKEAVKDMDIRKGYEAYITVNGQRVSDFKGGNVEITVPYEVPAGEAVAGFSVWYIDENGKAEKQKSSYDGKNKWFVVSHFSDYVIVYNEDDASVTNCPKDATCPIDPFTDTKNRAWYHNGVHYCIENGLMVGNGSDLFEPNGITTRAQIVTILWRMEGSPVVEDAKDFDDVTAKKWYYNAVRWASANEIVEGYDNGLFAPNDSITREQLAAILYRYCQYKGIDVSVGEETNILSYEDALGIRKWAIPGLQWACGSGLIQGIEKNGTMYLDPKGSAVRSQSATIIYRLCTEIRK